MAPCRVQVLLVSDLHYDLRQFDWVLTAAAEHDAVVIAGDLLDLSSAVPVAAQIPVIMGYLKRLAERSTVLVGSGNHDLTGRDENGEKAPTWLGAAGQFGVITDYRSTFLGDTLVSVCPFWDGPKGRARLDGWLTEQAALVRNDWCWIYHWPPPDEPVSWTGTRSYGDADLAGWIEQWQPRLVLSGHVHQAPLATGGSWITTSGTTTILNAGHELGPIPSHIVIDLDDGRAEWWSYEQTDARSFVGR